MNLYNTTSRFTTKEFTCPCGCGFGSQQEDINENLINKLNIIRTLYDKPMTVTSGARCMKHNKHVGGSNKSAHTPHPVSKQCRAVDIAVVNGEDRYTLLSLAMAVGIKRIGIGSNFIHMDVAWDLPSPNIFVY